MVNHRVAGPQYALEDEGNFVFSYVGNSFSYMYIQVTLLYLAREQPDSFSNKSLSGTVADLLCPLRMFLDCQNTRFVPHKVSATDGK